MVLTSETGGSGENVLTIVGRSHQRRSHRRTAQTNRLRSFGSRDPTRWGLAIKSVGGGAPHSWYITSRRGRGIRQNSESNGQPPDRSAPSDSQAAVDLVNTRPRSSKTNISKSWAGNLQLEQPWPIVGLQVVAK